MPAAGRHGSLAACCAVLLLCALALAGCGDGKSYRDRSFSRDASVEGSGSGGAGADAGEPAWSPPPPRDPRPPSEDVPVVPCVPAVASDALRARSAVMTRTESQSEASMSTDDLFQRFASHCRGCHIDQGLGGFQVTRQTFPTRVDEQALRRITSNGSDFMPPKPIGKPFADRDDDDPVVEFAGHLRAWLEQGRPKDRFYIDAAPVTVMGSAYSLQPAIGMALTNLGNCVPDPSATGFGAEQARSQELDDMFAEAKGFADLPDRLEDTDLFTLDSKVLASYGVVAFAPAYTLWADNAKKIRMVRVPRGESIRFDADTQQLAIPPNTRFYKTFLKKVIDAQGHESYRKMETRLILARPDRTLDDGTVETTALFGTYAWNEEETEAKLVRDPWRDGTPFRDRLRTYYTDEAEAEKIVRAAPADLGAQLRKVSRTYAIPGSKACIQCHMGSPTASFVLGFTPLQLERRPLGKGGVIEPAERDELNQVQRLIDYGVITGMSSPQDIALLEDSQGERKPRNEHELKAQGYMLGNCSHCHNPRGFPSITAPELRDMLDFLPSDAGGIFQFPLDRVSPRITRGALGQIRIPYITPSLYDIGPAIVTADEPPPKVLTCGVITGDIAVLSSEPILGPWRSLIYRNVDTPFSYSEDYAIFPHMPRLTPGYDCRSRQLLGSWMTSIPARWQPHDAASMSEDMLSNPKPSQEIYDDSSQPYVEVLPDDEDYRRAQRAAVGRVRQFQNDVRSRYNMCPDPGLDIVDESLGVGKYSPDIEYPSNEVLGEQDDGSLACFFSRPESALKNPGRPHWSVIDLSETPPPWFPRRSDWVTTLVDGEIAVEGTGTQAELERYGSELRNHCLLTGNADAARCGSDTAGRPPVRITAELKQLALSPYPLGYWAAKPECAFPGVRRASAFQGEDRPHWLASVAAADAGDPVKDPAVYEIAPGAQVFQLICRNCHGPAADSRSRLADTIADLTGGDTRVANLRDGIFGPGESPGSNRARVFGEAPLEGGITADDWAGRYVVWMGLGGTRRLIPSELIALIGRTPVLDTLRNPPDYNPQTAGANMLTMAEALCSDTLPFRQVFSNASPVFDLAGGRVVQTGSDEKYPLATVASNGDAELWERICSFENPAPVRVIVHPRWELLYGYYAGYDLRLEGEVAKPAAKLDLARRPLLFSRDAFPADAVVGDQRGALRTGIDAANLAPWCVYGGTSELRARCMPLCSPTCGAGGVDVAGPCTQECADACELEEQYTATRPVPYCPDGVATQVAQAIAARKLADNTGGLSGSSELQAQVLAQIPPAQWTRAQVEAWTRRGAMNAGLLVFTYLDALSKDPVTYKAPVTFDHCEQLEAPRK